MFRQFVPDTRHLWLLIIFIIIAIKIFHSTDISTTATINNNVIRDFALHAVLVPNIADLSGFTLAITDNTIVGKKHTSNYAGLSVSDI